VLVSPRDDWIVAFGPGLVAPKAWKPARKPSATNRSLDKRDSDGQNTTFDRWPSCERRPSGKSRLQKTDPRFAAGHVPHCGLFAGCLKWIGGYGGDGYALGRGVPLTWDLGKLLTEGKLPWQVKNGRPRFFGPNSLTSKLNKFG
jgi:hypothetical protein